MKTRVTIRDIAKVTGLHFTTVALCLRDSSRLKLETRKRVQQVAREMGYKPDPMVAALMVYRQTKRAPHFQSVLAWINNWPDRRALTKNTTFRRYFNAATERAQELGYLVEEFWLHEPGMTPDKMARILKARNVQGLLMAPQPRPYATLHFNFTGFSAIAFGYSMQPSVLNVITNHHFHTMKVMITNLVQLGYRRIGFYNEQQWDQNVESGLMASFALAFWTYPQLEYIPPLFNPQHDLPMLENWIKQQQPDVMISYDYVLKKITDLGYKIPRDFGFASLDVDIDVKHISGLNQNDIAIGKRAVDLLVGMIQRGETGVPVIPSCTLIESEWTPGKTLRKQKTPPVAKAAGPPIDKPARSLTT